MFITIKRAAIAALLAGAASLSPLSQATADSWTEHRQLEVARSSLRAVTFNDEIYVAGGAGLLGPQDVFELYDPIADFWVPLPSMPGGREQFGMSSAVGRIYVGGGYTAGGDGAPSADMWSFDPIQSIWQSAPGMPEGRAGHTMAAVENALYVIGGVGPAASKTLVLDIDSGKWRSIASMPDRRSSLSSIAVGNKIYVVGGVTQDNQASRRVDILDVDSQSWSRGPDMPNARAGAAIGLLNGEIHVAGGATFNPRKTYADHFVLNIQSGKWRLEAALPTPRYASAGATIDDRWYVLGGGAGSGLFVLFTAVDTVESYGP